MATDKTLIARTIETFPPLPVNSALRLRNQAEWVVAERKLSWEEWVDIRDAWAKHYNALVVALIRGDDEAMQRAEDQAEHNGNTYLLVEHI